MQNKSVAYFDKAATTYDTSFTHTEIGKMQRARVHHFLESQILKSENLSILEINCGTGEDATWFANKGNTVIATDASSKMIEVAQQKNTASTSANLVFEQAFFSQVKENYSSKKFDLIFSNFGGLNCVNAAELELLVTEFSTLLNPNGKLVFVIMGRKCCWESVYFLLKGNLKAAVRRLSKVAVPANLGADVLQNTFYFSPKEIKSLAKKKLRCIATKPIGLFVPPSYLEKFFSNKKTLLQFLFGCEKIFGGISFLSNYADHYYISFEKQK